MAKILIKDMMKSAAGRDSIALLLLARMSAGTDAKEKFDVAAHDLAQIGSDPDLSAAYDKSKIEAVSALYAKKVMNAAHGSNPEALFDTVLGGTNRSKDTYALANLISKQVPLVKKDVEAGMSCMICDEEGQMGLLRSLGERQFISAADPDTVFTVEPDWDGMTKITDQKTGEEKRGLIWLMTSIPKVEVPEPKSSTETPRI